MKKEKRSVILIIELLLISLFLGTGTIMLSALYTGTYKLAKDTTNLATANRVIANILEIADSCSSQEEYTKFLNSKGEAITGDVFNIGYDENGEITEFIKNDYIIVDINSKNNSKLIEINCRCINKEQGDCILEIGTKKYYGGRMDGEW